MAAPAPPSSASQDELNAIVCGVLPRQGAWSDEEYLWLTDRSRRLIEFTDGYVQESAYAYLRRTRRSSRSCIGCSMAGSGRVAAWSCSRRCVCACARACFREPDLLLLRDRADARCQDRYWLGADLVVEVVSPDRPERDLVDKRIDYAEAGIPEYWVVDPRDQTITVLELRADGYVEHGVHARGEEAASRSARRIQSPRGRGVRRSGDRRVG